jgi:hypothetical protein
MNSNDINKKTFYESVKTLVENDHPHVHLNQHKLFTLFSLGLQYLFYVSTKNPGTYIIRIEDYSLAQKLTYKAKDKISRSFLSRLILSRKLKYEKSMFYLDFFNPNTWGITSQLPPNRLQGAIIVKNTINKPVSPVLEGQEITQEESEEAKEDKLHEEFLKNKLYYNTLQKVCPKTIVIAFEDEFTGSKVINFPFIVKEKEQIKGIKLADDLDPELYS